MVKSPKLYFTDTGLAAYLMGFQSAAALRGSLQVGALWENHVIGQWLRWRDWQAPAAGLWYWRNQGGAEVDLVIEWNGRLIGIECKVAERPDAGAAKGLACVRAFYGEALMPQGYVACSTGQPFDLNDWVTARDGWQVWPLREAG